MKQKSAIVILSLMTVLYSAPFLGHEEKIETATINVEETSVEEITQNIEWQTGWVKNILNVRNEPLLDANVYKIYTEGTEIFYYNFDDKWICLENGGYARKEFITQDYAEIEYINLMKEQEVSKEWFLKYKEFMNAHEDKPETIYDCFTKSELDLLLSVVQAEIGNYSFEQKVNVANVIFNRVYHEKFGNTIYEVLIPSQFETISNGRINRVNVTEDTILAVEYAFLFPDTTNGALFFDSNGMLNYEFIGNDGAHNLYKIKGE